MAAQAADTLAPRCFGRVRRASLTRSDQRRVEMLGVNELLELGRSPTNLGGGLVGHQMQGRVHLHTWTPERDRVIMPFAHIHARLCLAWSLRPLCARRNSAFQLDLLATLDLPTALVRSPHLTRHGCSEELGV